uniref:Uncharacterized protein n=1 Tax=Bombyx mori TaxID=7091 RepID=Q86QT7_BOMMO|nr:unknown [Bombyx mori]
MPTIYPIMSGNCLSRMSVMPGVNQATAYCHERRRRRLYLSQR